jgi:DNA-binding XRE family transcriptional regulator
MDGVLFRRLCLTKGAVTEEERAELVGVNRGTLRRWIKGEVTPLMSTLRRVAQRLDTTVETLWTDQ